MKAIHLLLLATFFLFIFSCNKSKSSTSELKADMITSNAPPELNKVAENNVADLKLEKTDTTGGISLQGQTPNQNPDWDKKIIKTAFLKLEVKDIKAYAGVVHKAAKQYGGYVADEEQNQSEEKIESTISVKVPVDQFESIMNQLPGSAEKMVEKKITTEDVTGEVVDTKSRLQTKEQMRLKYLEFLKQSKNMADVLKVQSEINDIQEEIESASTRINYLSHQSAFTTINLTFYQPLPGYNPPSENPAFFTRVVTAFKSGFHFIAEILIGLISIWPLLLLVFGGWIFVKKYVGGISSAKQKV